MSDEIDGFLAHYGVKGMKWGVRKDRDGSSRKSSGSSKKKESGDGFEKAIDEFYASKSHSELQKEGMAKLKAQANQTFATAKDSTKQVVGESRERKAARIDKSVDKLNREANRLNKEIDATNPGPLGAYRRANLKAQLSEIEKNRDNLKKAGEQVRAGKLTTNEKILIGVGTAAAVGVLAYYGKQKYDQQAFYKKNKPLIDANRKKTEEQWAQLFGESPRMKRADGNHPQSIAATMTGGFYPGLKNKKALDRPEFTIPKETVFQRMSNGKETGEGYEKGTYSTFLSNDNALYGASQEFGNKTYRVNYQPKSDVKVPSTRTVLKALQESQKELTGKRPSDKETFALYHELSGGGWSNPPSVGLINQLKKQGYSALVDDMDAGYIGDLPVVFFGEATNVTATKRTAKDRLQDQGSFMPTIKKYA